MPANGFAFRDIKVSLSIFFSELFQNQKWNEPGLSMAVIVFKNKISQFLFDPGRFFPPVLIGRLKEKWNEIALIHKSFVKLNSPISIYFSINGDFHIRDDADKSVPVSFAYSKSFFISGCQKYLFTSLHSLEMSLWVCSINSL